MSLWCDAGRAAQSGPGTAPTPWEPAPFIQLAAADSHKPAGKTTARPKVDPRQQRINELTEENRSLKTQISALSVNRGSSGESIPELEARLQELRNELMTIRQSAANALQIQAERDHLHESVVRLERELETVKRAKVSLEADSRQSWFLVGAGVMLGGIVLGLILPHLSWRKRSSWDTF
ncbi:TIGR04211 family SH3 domain-containing protein [Methylotetracoccus oryzae]|uniref:TIGR04211 family SH3 domain-containing protein n=1 Tax=Methylotetracoccus oryzae TaxID=1919059 RepID=UPI001F21B7C5|nr:TIGR04211 family SH3 domain-containing protein [Methylotetracoccus oryzae]